MNRRIFFNLVWLLVVAFSLRANSISLEQQAPFFSVVPPTGGGGGGGGAFAVLRTASQAGTGGATTVTMDTTGATRLFALVTGGGLSHPALTDGTGNTWTADIDWNNSHVSVFSCLNPTHVGTGHSISINNVNNCNIIFVAVTGGSSPAFQAASAGGTTGNWGGATVNAGSLTPSGGNNLFLAVAWWDVGAGGASDTVDSGFTKIDAFSTNPGCGGAYKIKSSDSTAENPGWKHTGASDGVFIQATYTP
jgi:hypothetical protein